MGYVYVVKIYVMPKIYFCKIGATTMPSSRISNLGKNVKICCISKPHYNYFENESILHKHFDDFRVPKSPKSASKSIRPELFFLSLTEIFRTLPDLKMETSLDNCIAHTYANGNAVWYESKNKTV